MITWIIGNSNSGKTTLADYLIQFRDDKWVENYQGKNPYNNCVLLDGDNMRKVWVDLKYSDDDRYIQNIRIANLAKILDKQGFNVLVASICPYKKLRKKVKEITNCKFIYIEGGKKGKEYPFEHPKLY